MAKARILVADDEPILGNTLKKILGELGYVVALCDRGEAFFQFLDDQKPDIVLLDIYLGSVNGIQLLNRMRQEGWQTPVIMMTAVLGFLARSCLKPSSPAIPGSLMSRKTTANGLCAVIARSASPLSAVRIP